MDDIRKRDLELFAQEALSGCSLFRMAMFIGLGFLLSSGPIPVIPAFLVSAVGIIRVLYAAYKRSVSRRFTFQRFGYLWKTCKERHGRLKKNFVKLKRHSQTELVELEKSIDRTMPEIYRSLRRADLVLREIQASEGHVPPPPSDRQNPTFDPQAQELYKVADRNVSEYKHYFRQAMSGVERSEAQAIVFSTTLDTFRIRLLNTLIAGRALEAESREFLNVVAEAKMQFAAIDRALEEIENMPFPRDISTLDMDPAIRQEMSGSGPVSDPIAEAREELDP